MIDGLTGEVAEAVVSTASNYIEEHSENASTGCQAEGVLDQYLNGILGNSSLGAFFSGLENISADFPYSVFLAWSIACLRSGKFSKALHLAEVLGEKSAPLAETGTQVPSYSRLRLAPYHAHSICLKAECLRCLGESGEARTVAEQGLKFCVSHNVPEMLQQFQEVVAHLSVPNPVIPQKVDSRALEPRDPGLTALPIPIKLLHSVAEICAILDVPKDKWDLVRKYNEKYNGPIKSPGAGHSPLVDAAELLTWWNSMVEHVEDGKSTVEEKAPLKAVPYGRKGGLVWDGRLSVKPSREPQSGSTAE